MCTINTSHSGSLAERPAKDPKKLKVKLKINKNKQKIKEGKQIHGHFKRQTIETSHEKT